MSSLAQRPMEYYRLTIPIPKQPWRWLRFRITTILYLATLLAILLAWRRDHKDLAAELVRLQHPGPHYEAEQAVGPPDVQNQGDSERAWCPASIDAGNEWLVLEYYKTVAPSAIVVHENYAPGAVVRIADAPIWGKETTLWEGTYVSAAGPAGSVATLPVANKIKTSRIKLYLDTAAAPGWNEIDAVGLVDGTGEVLWASGAKASSTWY